MPSFATVLPAAATLLLVACAQPPERAERDLRPPAAGRAQAKPVPVPQGAPRTR